MEAETLVDTLAATLSETDVERINDTLGNVKSKELTHTLTDMLQKEKPGNLATKWPLRRLGHFSLRCVTC